MNNKGFSMVELIIVIAIMAILAGAIAPLLIDYINKSRISTDIDTGSAIGRAITAAVTNESVFYNVVDHPTEADMQNVNQMDGDAFHDEVFSSFAVDTFVGKSKRDVNGNSLDRNFYYTVDATRNVVAVYYGGKDSTYQVFPVVSSRFTD